jgi:hypothetical protein
VIAKATFLNACVCQKLGWLQHRKQVEAVPSLAEKLRMTEGREVHCKARSLRPDGLAAEATASLIGRSSTKSVYEATFVSDPFVARADMLVRAQGAWNVLEVKSSTNERPELIDDLAYTVMVCEKAGLPVNRATLLLVSKDYRLGMPDEKLFTEVDATTAVHSRVAEFGAVADGVAESVLGDRMPEARSSYECRDCPLIEECVTKGIPDPIFNVPRLGAPKCKELISRGILRIADIPSGFPLSDSQRRVVDCIRSGRRYVGTGLAARLAAVRWPAYYLDFETMKPVIPLYPDTAPHTQVPTQYSIHKCDKPGNVVQHLDYLADPRRDCRRELAERLLDDLAERGSIVAYSTFEKTTIDGLAKLDSCKDLAARLENLKARIFDLHDVIRLELCDPLFHGRTSIKVVLPALVPEMSYDGLAIADGGTALATFTLMVRGDLTGQPAEEAKVNLREYCKRDTLAMVKLHEHLAQCV